MNKQMKVDKLYKTKTTLTFFLIMNNHVFVSSFEQVSPEICYYVFNGPNSTKKYQTTNKS